MNDGWLDLDQDELFAQSGYDLPPNTALALIRIARAARAVYDRTHFAEPWDELRSALAVLKDGR